METYEADDAQVETDVDRVEADVVVAATQEAVWAVVSEPGWWMNDGPLDDHEVERDEDGVYHVEDPDAGEWLVEREDEDPMDMISFRWDPRASDELDSDQCTRIEISLSEEDGGTAVHIEESGISTLDSDEAVVRQIWENEQGMWEDALAQIAAHFA
ncbi:SRPBCC domain-containing protein [Schaalia sp. ZJ1691]|uniref:SRPBCC domain-containing protein n=1 Tax=Schaalia sp. ZJ1691 TaxID=2709404 RepID=UPI0013EA89DB|nr:SRPBCC domain-containing protein [Schaalia sp. ZJ1691]